MDFLKFLEIFTFFFFAILLFISLLLSPFFNSYPSYFIPLSLKIIFPWNLLSPFFVISMVFSSSPCFQSPFFLYTVFLFLIFLDLFCLQYLLVVMFHCYSISFLSFFDSITFSFSWSHLSFAPLFLTSPFCNSFVLDLIFLFRLLFLYLSFSRFLISITFSSSSSPFSFWTPFSWTLFRLFGNPLCILICHFFLYLSFGRKRFWNKNFPFGKKLLSTSLYSCFWNYFPCVTSFCSFFCFLSLFLMCLCVSSFLQLFLNSFPYLGVFCFVVSSILFVVCLFCFLFVFLFSLPLTLFFLNFFFLQISLLCFLVCSKTKRLEMIGFFFLFLFFNHFSFFIFFFFEKNSHRKSKCRTCFFMTLFLEFQKEMFSPSLGLFFGKKKAESFLSLRKNQFSIFVFAFFLEKMVFVASFCLTMILFFSWKKTSGLSLCFLSFSLQCFSFIFFTSFSLCFSLFSCFFLKKKIRKHVFLFHFPSIFLMFFQVSASFFLSPFFLFFFFHSQVCLFLNLPLWSHCCSILRKIKNISFFSRSFAFIFLSSFFSTLFAFICFYQLHCSLILFFIVSFFCLFFFGKKIILSISIAHVLHYSLSFFSILFSLSPSLVFRNFLFPFTFFPFLSVFMIFPFFSPSPFCPSPVSWSHFSFLSFLFVPFFFILFLLCSFVFSSPFCFTFFPCSLISFFIKSFLFPFVHSVLSFVYLLVFLLCHHFLFIPKNLFVSCLFWSFSHSLWFFWHSWNVNYSDSPLIFDISFWKTKLFEFPSFHPHSNPFFLVSFSPSFDSLHVSSP